MTSDKYYIHPLGFASDVQSFTRTHAKYLCKEVNAVLSRSGIARELYIGSFIEEYATLDGQGKLYPTDGFSILVSIKQASRRSGYASIGSKGQGGIVLTWDNTPIDLDTLLYMIIHEFGHVFGCGITESYYTNCIPASSVPEDQGVDSREFETDDYWSWHQDWRNDPMRTNEGPFVFSRLNSYLINDGRARQSMPTCYVELAGFRSEDLLYTCLRGKPELVEVEWKDGVAFIAAYNFQNSDRNVFRLVRWSPVTQVSYFTLFDLHEAWFFGGHKLELPVYDPAKANTIELRNGYALVYVGQPNTILESSPDGLTWTPTNAYPHPGVYKHGLISGKQQEFFRLVAGPTDISAERQLPPLPL